MLHLSLLLPLLSRRQNLLYVLIGGGPSREGLPGNFPLPGTYFKDTFKDAVLSRRLIKDTLPTDQVDCTDVF